MALSRPTCLDGLYMIPHVPQRWLAGFSVIRGIARAWVVHGCHLHGSASTNPLTHHPSPQRLQPSNLLEAEQLLQKLDPIEGHVPEGVPSCACGNIEWGLVPEDHLGEPRHQHSANPADSPVARSARTIRSEPNRYKITRSVLALASAVGASIMTTSSHRPIEMMLHVVFAKPQSLMDRCGRQD